MKRNLAGLCLLALLQASLAHAQPSEFSFGVIGHTFRANSDETALREAIAATDRDNLAFVVVNGIKSSSEPCSDDRYGQRKAIFETAKNGLLVSLAATDWSECRNARDRSAAVERLNRLREMFFSDEFSLGASRIPLSRQSATAKFRNYAENARWEIGDILFATINLPSNNNHYRIEAGRNSEFEDRLIANRDWLHRLYTMASSRKMAGIVLIADGNPLAAPGLADRINPLAKRDGFQEVRQQITALSSKFAGRVLVIHSQLAKDQASAAGIAWHGKLGELGLASGWVKVTVNPMRPALFSVGNPATDPRNPSQ